MIRSFTENSGGTRDEGDAIDVGDIANDDQKLKAKVKELVS